MDVQCEKCGSEYELDDNKVTSNGVSVKCTSCGNVFRVTKPTAAATSGDWMIKQQNGQVFKFKELTTLQRWIVERRVTREDQISKTGDTWKKLGEIFELASFFQVAEQAAGAPVGGALKQQIATVDDPGKRSGTPLIIAVSMVALALIAGVFMARAHIAEWIRGPDKVVVQTAASDALGAHLRAGFKELRKDTFAGFAQADAEFAKALALQATHPGALAGAAMTLTAWAQYVREDAQDIDETIKATAAGKTNLGAPEIAALASELGKKQAEAAARAERAYAYMKRALELDPRGAQSLKAAARYYALTSAQEPFKALQDKAQQAGLGEDPDFIYALALLRAGEDTESATTLLQRVLDKDAEHVAARYQLALMAYKRRDPARALTLVDEVLKLAPDHSRALALKGKFEPPKTEKAPEAAPLALPPAVPVVESFNDLLNKANTARQRERIKQAVELYERALLMRPDNAEALAGLGFCYLDIEQVGNAIAQFQKAIAANSRYSDAHMGLGEAYRARGQKRDAVKHYQRYLELAPDGPEAPVARNALKDLGQE